MNSFSNPVFLILLASWVGVLACSLFLWLQRLERVYLKNWYDLSKNGPNEEMEWDQIRELMKKNPPQDRLTCSTLRFPLKHLVLDIVGFILALTILCASLKLILCVSHWSTDLVKLGVFAGVPALVISVAAIFYQVRLKSRSENRQEWINSLRTEIGVLIGSFPPPNASDRSVEAVAHEMQHHLTMLELYLNPHERVHRGLMAVLRFMHGSARIGIDDEADEKLCIPQTRRPWKNHNEDNSELEWRTKAMRLANVLLKREWERVKHAR